tara:strand:- start:2627 stop:2827 length:201 start_codon:yes stop_codon:yes gene_type:complete
MTDTNGDHLVFNSVYELLGAIYDAPCAETLSSEEWIDVLAGLRARLGRTRADLYRLDERIVKAINE